MIDLTLVLPFDGSSFWIWIEIIGLDLIWFSLLDACFSL
jgi:hypothetical protein